MNRFSFLSFIFFLTGIGCFLFAFLEGNLQIGVIFIIPFFIGTSIWSFFGVIFFFLSFLFITVKSIEQHHNINDSTGIPFDHHNVEYEPKDTKVKMNGIIFIGPIPIVFGQNLKLLVLIATFCVIVFFLLSLIILYLNY